MAQLYRQIEWEGLIRRYISFMFFSILSVFIRYLDIYSYTKHRTFFTLLHAAEIRTNEHVPPLL